MILQILLLLSIVVQIIAAITAIRLTKRTKFNSAWILFSIAIVLISIQLTTEMLSLIESKPPSYKSFSHWSTILLSLCVAIGIFYMKKIINYIEAINKQRELTEKRILHTVISTEEKERQRFSKELHDGLGPLLSSAKMSVSILNKVNTDPHSREIIENASLVINEAIKELKDISNNISPSVLTNFGIASALNNFISRLMLPQGQKITFDTNIREQRFENNLEAIFYRVGCELINNAVKHSSASLITVSLRHVRYSLELVVQDNGVGIDRNRLNRETPFGMGLSNIHSRISSVNGSLTIDTSDKGTCVTVQVKV